MSEPAGRSGRVITFYSYKGGTGRSMALANVAWILASQGHKVLAIDWDLEAPGLHRYFQPFLPDPALTASEGLMDFVVSFAAAAVRPPERQGDSAQPWFMPLADLRRYAFSLQWDGFPEGGTLDLVPAGRQDAGYAVRVNSFNWHHFYDKLGGGVFLEEMKRQLRGRYDYILVDSRTGVSDTSGLCTVQMPDDLVVCFTLNQQSIEGASSAAGSALQQRRRPDGSSGLRVLPVPTRVDLSEKERLDLARTEARQRFGAFLEDWLDEDQPDAYWGTVEVPYVPFYALEEVLATFGDPPSHTNSILSAMEAVTGWLTRKQVTRLGPQDESRRQETLQRFLRKAPPPSVPARSYPVCVSFARNDDGDELQRFIADLAEEAGARTGLPKDQIAYKRGSVSADEKSTREITDAAASSAVLLAIVSPAYVSSKANPEWDQFRQANKPIIHVPWVPTHIPPYMRELPFFQPEGYGGKEGMRALLRIGKYEDEYRSSVMELAKLVADHVWKAAMRLDRDLEVGPPLKLKQSAPKSQLKVVVLAERIDGIGSLRSNTHAYGLRRRDWRPFDAMQGKSAGEIVAGFGQRLGVPVRMMSLHDFEAGLQQLRRSPGDELIVLVDPWTHVIPAYRGLLRKLTHVGEVPAAIIVCYDADSETREERARLPELHFSPPGEGAPFPNPHVRLLIAESPSELEACLQEAHRYLSAVTASSD